MHASWINVTFLEAGCTQPETLLQVVDYTGLLQVANKLQQVC